MLLEGTQTYVLHRKLHLRLSEKSKRYEIKTRQRRHAAIVKGAQMSRHPHTHPTASIVTDIKRARSAPNTRVRAIGSTALYDWTSGRSRTITPHAYSHLRTHNNEISPPWKAHLNQPAPLLASHSCMEERGRRATTLTPQATNTDERNIGRFVE